MTTITLYSLPTSQCRACWSTEHRLKARGIEFTKIRVDENPEALEKIRAFGYTQAPVVVKEVDGKVVDHWSGFSELKIEALANSA